jgi:OmpA-OmpF porin, OOP family
MAMTYAFTKKQMALAVSCALALGMAANAAKAETNPADTGYLVDQNGTVVRSGSGLCWHSGVGPPASTPECEPVAAAAPAAKVIEPAPLPVAVATPAPARERITLDADALFDFNKSTLRPAGKAALDEFASKTKSLDPEMINAVGHTDRLGSEAYNQRLSERRVEAVKAYLVSQGIDANRIHTEGRGETQPITKAGDCEGGKRAAVIACLQPDRRVEIEVVGARIASR